MTLKSICQNALNEIGGFEVPESFVDSTNLTAKQCLALANREGKTLEREHRWSELIATHTFTTTAATANYDLPSDFRAFANMSQWDRLNQYPMIGPASAERWQWLQSGIASGGATIQRWWRIQDGDMYIYPTPTSTGDTIAFDYYSKNWVTLQLDSSSAASFTADLDTTRIDESLFELGVKWRFLQAKGVPFQAEYAEYEAVKEEVRADNGGKGSIKLGYDPITLTHLPDQGYGS